MIQKDELCAHRGDCWDQARNSDKADSSGDHWPCHRTTKIAEDDMVTVSLLKPPKNVIDAPVALISIQQWT